MAPVAVPVSTRLLPLHIGFGVAVAVTPVGVGFTTNDAVVALAVHEPTVATNVYTPALPATTPVTPVLNDVGLVIAIPPGPLHA